MKIFSYGHIDWGLFLGTIPLLFAGLITMRELGSENNYFFTRQLVWVAVASILFFASSFIDWRFLKKGELLLVLFVFSVLTLGALLVLGKVVRGAASWINLYFFSIEPADPIKILLIAILAKYFSRRHVEIAHFKHIFVSAFYALVPFVLIFLQPDFGSAIIIFLIWLGMIIVSGVSKKHLAFLSLSAVFIFSMAWFFALKPYQKSRITSFLNPIHDIRGAGYNAFQSTIAVGSGEVFGKGIGYGSQSRLQFLPEHQTDFIFAAFAEEWGFIGVLFIFLFFSIVVWRILKNALFASQNFESFFGLGLAIFIISHFIINVGMNIGLLPITGINLPFLSYGGTHLITLYLAIGMFMGMRRHGSQAVREDPTVELLGQ